MGISYRGDYSGSETHRRWYQKPGIFGRSLLTERGVTKGYPVSSTIFNVIVDTVVRLVLLEVCGTQDPHHGFRW